MTPNNNPDPPTLLGVVSCVYIRGPNNGRHCRVPPTLCMMQHRSSSLIPTQLQPTQLQRHQLATSVWLCVRVRDTVMVNHLFCVRACDETLRRV